MKQNLSSLTSSVLNHLRWLASKKPSLETLQCQQLPRKQAYFEREHDVTLKLANQIVSDGLVEGKILSRANPSEMTARFRGIHIIEKSAEKVNSDCPHPFPQYPDFLKEDKFELFESRTFYDQEGTVQWKQTDSENEGLLWFTLDSNMPSSSRLLMQGLRSTVLYLLEVRAKGIKYVRTVEIKWPEQQKIVCKQISYSAMDFQRVRLCCINKGIYRLETIYPQNRYSRGSTILGKINFFRKTRGQLLALNMCRIDLYARIKWKIRSVLPQKYLRIASKIICLKEQPEYGVISSRYCLGIPDNIPTSTRNLLYSIAYFTIMTPIHDTYSVSILQETIRQIGVNSKKDNHQQSQISSEQNHNE